MQALLFRRTLRQLKANLFRYLALLFLIIVAMGIVAGVVGSAESVIRTVNEKADANQLEDGQFSLFVPLTKSQSSQLTAMGVTLEECFSLDFSSEDGSTLRLMKNRERINRIEIDSGRPAGNTQEIVLERLYASAHDLFVGDQISVGGHAFTICGIGTTADYDLCLANRSDMSADGSVFGTAFVTEDAYEALLAGGEALHTEEYCYSYLLGDGASEQDIKDYLLELTIDSGETSLKAGNLLGFVPAKDNPRIKAANDDVEINIRVGIMAGVLIMILIAYVISVFTVHSIDQESAMIGALYALGLKRKELLLHYTLLPTVLCLFGGICGTLLGYSRFMLQQMAGDTFAYFSIPAIRSFRNPLLLLYGILLPPLAAFAVSTLTIRKRLNCTALSLLRKEAASNHPRLRAHPRRASLPHGKSKEFPAPAAETLSFQRAFRLRQLLREKRSCFAMLAGIFLSLLVLILGLNCYVFCRYIETDTVADTRYEYLYQMKYPENTVPAGGHAAYVKGLKKEVLGYEMEISIIGLTEDNPFFPAINSSKTGELSISSSVASKFGLKQGDELLLQDTLEENAYAFTVTEVVPYTPGLCAFMEIGSMRELFGQETGYYNAIYSDCALDIDTGRLYAVSTKDDVKKSASIFLSIMTPLITIMTGAAVLIFLIVLYQMTKVMIDRSSTSISLMKVFGYRDREIRSLYLDGSLLLVAVGTLFLLPIAKYIMDAVYPSFVANVACGMKLSWPPLLYAAVYLGTLLCYLIIRAALMRRIKQTTPAEILKNRE